jgi:hypothetical protein
MNATVRILAVVAVAAALGGCMPPPDTGNISVNPVYSQVPPPPPQSDPPPQAEQEYDIDGLWCFRDGRGRSVVNLIKRIPGGIYASPYKRRGKSVFYREVSPNLFDDRGSQYLFFSSVDARWKDVDHDWHLSRCR